MIKKKNSQCIFRKFYLIDHYQMGIPKFEICTKITLKNTVALCVITIYFCPFELNCIRIDNGKIQIRTGFRNNVSVSKSQGTLYQKYS